jgi:hypothetical protein
MHRQGKEKKRGSGLCCFFLLTMFLLPLQASAGSTDTWTLRSTESFSGVAFGNNVFVAGGLAGIYTSDDGITWKKTASDLFPGNVVFANGLFFAVGDAGIHISPDGQTWRQVFSADHVLDVTFGKNLFVAVGLEGVYTSPEGEVWTNTGFKWPANCYSDMEFLPPVCHFNAVAFGNNTFVAVGITTAETPQKNMYTSADGKKWTARLDAEAPVNDVTFAEGIFVAVSSGELMGTSTNGASWTPWDSTCVEWLYGLSYGKGSFVTVGDWGSILSSPDGKTWTVVNIGLDINLRGVAFGKETFVAVGDAGILQSDTVTGPFCQYSFTPLYKTMSANALTLNINVSATGDPFCEPPAVEYSAGWITSATLLSWKTNKGTVKVVVPANISSVPRSTDLKIANLPFTIAQAGKPCTITKVAPASLSFPKAGGSGTFAFTTNPKDCQWVAASTVWWIHPDTTGGTGDGSIGFTVDENPGTANRTGYVAMVIVVDPKKKASFTVTQKAK